MKASWIVVAIIATRRHRVASYWRVQCGKRPLRCIGPRDIGHKYEELWMATAAHLLTPLSQLSPAVADWVESVRELTQPRAIHWCDGSDAEQRELTAKLIARRRAEDPQPGVLSRMPPRPLEPERCRSRRAPHLHLLALERKTRVRTTTGWPRTRRTRRCATCSAAACESARCTSFRTAWDRSTRRCPAAVSRSLTARTSF